MTQTTTQQRLVERSAYAIICDVYRGKTARRSGLPYINHIHEGVYVFAHRFGWQDVPIDAFCVHPIFQTDKLLVRANSGEIGISSLSPQTVLLAMEYRRVANAYLSTNAVREPKEIELSPIESVNQMLAADKVQNKKDFVAKIYKSEDRGSYHRASDRYLAYFDSWLAALGVSTDEYETLAAQLQQNFPHAAT